MAKRTRTLPRTSSGPLAADRGGPGSCIPASICPRRFTRPCGRPPSIQTSQGRWGWRSESDGWTLGTVLAAKFLLGFPPIGWLSLSHPPSADHPVEFAALGASSQLVARHPRSPSDDGQALASS